MRILITGASGVLGRSLSPLLATDHDVVAPGRRDLDLFDAAAVTEAVVGCEAVYHLATSIPPRDRMGDRSAWAANDRLREVASRLLVDAALSADTAVYVQPTVAMVYPPGHADEQTQLRDVPVHLRSALVAEEEALRFARAGRTGVALRLGLLYGPGTGASREAGAGVSLHVDDAGAALAAALAVPSGVYNVVEDGGRIDNARFKAAAGWAPRR